MGVLSPSQAGSKPPGNRNSVPTSPGTPPTHIQAQNPWGSQWVSAVPGPEGRWGLGLQVSSGGWTLVSWQVPSGR